LFDAVKVIDKNELGLCYDHTLTINCLNARVKSNNEDRYTYKSSANYYGIACSMLANHLPFSKAQKVTVKEQRNNIMSSNVLNTM